MSDIPSPEPFSLDFLMSEDPLKLAEQDIDMIIQYHRNIRADRASGMRKAKVSTAPVPESVSKLIKSAKPVVTMNRRGL
jgi:hypothetical protein